MHFGDALSIVVMYVFRCRVAEKNARGFCSKGESQVPFVAFTLWVPQTCHILLFRTCRLLDVLGTL
jgi:hypothetical protein